MQKRLDRRLTALLLGLAVVAGVVAVSAMATSSRPTVKVMKTAGLGKLLATSSGRTLYHYTDEHGKIDCKGGCAKLWPPLLVKAGAKPTVGPGLSVAKLGTIKRPDGGTQVTYNGFALYRYAPDTKAGEVKGQGVFKAWYVIAPTGKLVRRAAAAAEPAAPPTSTTPTDTTDDGTKGGGYDYG